MTKSTLPPKLAAQLSKALNAGKGEREIARTLKLTRHQVRKAIEERKLAEAAIDNSIPMLMPVEVIHVGARIRKDYGDVVSLARSIDANGLLHPIVIRKCDMSITPGKVCYAYELIAGERRLRAWQESKFRGQPIPVRIIDLASIRRGEFAENHERKDFSPSELVEIKRQLELEFDLSGEADRRKRAGKKVPQGEAGRVNDLAGAVAGRSGRTVEKAEAVVRAADEDPERFGRLKEQMDKSGKVDGPFKRLQNMRAGDALRAEPPPLPGNGPYRTIVIDPPWPADLDGDRDTEGRGYYPYQTMSIDKIAAVEVASIAHPRGCALWLWITNFHLVRGVHVKLLQAWGFTGSTLLTWCKPIMGQGQRLRGATEHAILAVRGEVPCLGGAQKSWFKSEVEPLYSGRVHSGKPAEFFEIVQIITPASRYAYLFAGASLPENWDGHGDRHVAEAEIPGADGVIANLDDLAERLGRPEGAP